MPKARKKAKKVRSKSRSKPKKTARPDARGQGSVKLLTAVIDRLGASVRPFKDRHTLMVAHFNHAPFVIDLKALKILEVPAVPTGTVLTPSREESEPPAPEAA